MFFGPIRLGTREISPKQYLKLEARFRNVRNGKTYLFMLNVCVLEAAQGLKEALVGTPYTGTDRLSYQGFVELSRHWKLE